MALSASRPRVRPSRHARALRAGASGALLALAACSSGGAATEPVPPPPQPACTFANPVGPGADPWVVKRGDTYYFVESRDGGIWVSRSAVLTELRREPRRVWSPPDTGWNSRNVWAPELHRIGERWYIYYAAGRQGPPFLTQRAGVLESVGDDPQGAYVDRGMVWTGDDSTRGPNVWAIDMTVATIDGRLHAIWSGWDENARTDRTPQHLYAAPLATPWRIAEYRRRLSSPSEPWERGTELSLQEGPTVLQRDGRTYVVYSTNESWLPAYRLGLLRIEPGTGPLDSTRVTKTGPVFTGTSTVFGPGHASFTTSPDGSEDWIVYHAKTSATPGWDRAIRMQRFGWRPDGTPDFGTPVATGVRLPRPAGECP